MRVTMGCLLWVQDLIYVLLSASAILHPDSKVHRANMGPTWGRQDPGGPHVGPMNFAIWAGIVLCMCPANERLTILLQLDANFTWSCHNMEMLAPLLPFCLENPLATSRFLSQKASNMGFNVFFDGSFQTNCWTNNQVASDLRYHETRMTSMYVNELMCMREPINAPQQQQPLFSTYINFPNLSQFSPKWS